MDIIITAFAIQIVVLLAFLAFSIEKPAGGLLAGVKALVVRKFELAQGSNSNESRLEEREN